MIRAVVRVGDGNGSFVSQIPYSTGFESQPVSVAVADFDSDSFLDMIVANYATNSIVLLLGYGDGTFQDAKVVSIAYGSHPFSLVSGDFNNDRKLDFAVANYGTDNLKIMLQTC